VCGLELDVVKVFLAPQIGLVAKPCDPHRPHTALGIFSKSWVYVTIYKDRGKSVFDFHDRLTFYNGRK